jgi:hypothetical protein
MIEIPESTLSKNSDPRRYALYSKLQAELTNVITGAWTGTETQLDKNNNHQLYDALTHISTHSPNPIVMTFNAGEFRRGDSEWLNRRMTQSIPGLILDSTTAVAYSFLLTLWIDEERDGSYQLRDYSHFKCVYQIRSGKWLFQMSSVSDRLNFKWVSNSNSTHLIISREDELREPQFSVNVLSSGEIEITSSTFEFLYPTKIRITQVKSLRGP